MGVPIFMLWFIFILIFLGWFLEMFGRNRYSRFRVHLKVFGFDELESVLLGPMNSILLLYTSRAKSFCYPRGLKLVM